MAVNDFLIEVPLRRIQNNPWQTRPIDPGHRDELAASIRKNGLYQYSVGRVVDAESGKVVPLEEVRRLYEQGSLFERQYYVQIGIGHHRRAAYEQLAVEDGRFSSFPVKIRHLTDEGMADIVMRENDERKELSVIERANAFRQRKESFGWTTTKLARRYKTSRSTVSNLLRIVQHLPPEAQEAVHEHKVSLRATQVLASAYNLQFADSNQIAETLLEDAIAGASSSKLRAKFRRVVKMHTTPLDRLPFPLDRDFTVGDTPACTDCPQVISLGFGGTKERRCPDRSCREYKRSVWHRQQLEEAARETNLPIVPNGARSSEHTRLGRNDVAAILDNAGCEHGNLSLWRQNSNAISGPDLERWPQVGYCCYHGYAGTCHCRHQGAVRCANGSETGSPKHPRIDVERTAREESPKHTKPESAEEEDARLERIIEPTAEVLAKGLAALDPRVLTVLYSQLNPQRRLNAVRQRAEVREEEILHAIARQLINHELPYNSTPESARRSMRQLLSRAGIKPPWKSQGAME